MLSIHALPAFADNYIWLLQDEEPQCCAVVDPGDAEPVLAWLATHPGYRLTDILLTHHHSDHTGGVARLKDSCGARVIGPAKEPIAPIDVPAKDGDQLQVLGQTLTVLETPGHTLGHVVYLGEIDGLPRLFCGDTLFAAGCGRVFEGSMAQMYASLRRLSALLANTLIYCAHEYTLANLRFARAAAPTNPAIAERLQQVEKQRQNGLITLPSTVAIELQTNPFLRTEQGALRAQLPGQPADGLAAFTELRSWKDRF